MLNIPVDKRGLIHENDQLRLKELAKFIEKTFSKNYILDQKIITSSSEEGYPKLNLIDNDLNSYWVSDSSDKSVSITIKLKSPEEVNTFLIQEYIPLGQRIKSFTFELFTAKEGWKNICKGTTIGNKRLLRFETQKIDGLRFKVSKSKAQVVISNIGLFKAPEIDE